MGGEKIQGGDLGTGFKEVLAELDREQARLKIRLETRRFGKPATIVEGLKMDREVLEDLSRKMKKALATGGTIRDGAILLQGDHRKMVAKMLLELGYSKSSIEMV